jgi:hypothetical protein
MQKCDFFGNRLWTDDGILAVDLDYAQDDFELVPCAFGGANLLWMQGYQMVHDVYSQWISPNGVLAWGDSGLALPQWEYEQLYPVGFFYDNKLFAFWQDQRDGGWNIYGQSVAFQAPPMRISDLQITLLGDSLSISWNPVELDSLGQPMTAEYYNIYQGVDPYFDISSLIPVAQTIDTIWFDVNLVHQDQKYYIVTAVIDSLEEGEK